MENNNLFLDVAKMFALNFAKWLAQNKWIRNNFTNDKYFSPISLYLENKTIVELYEIFLKEERTKLKENESKKND
jgi:hypothetical protein